ncbi:MAG TPA: hypothetical protein VIV60_26555 [Polyangiaceae bacterium]
MHRARVARVARRTSVVFQMALLGLSLALIAGACTGFTANESRSKIAATRQPNVTDRGLPRPDAGLVWDLAYVRSAVERGEFTLAEPELLRMVARDPRRPNAQILLAEVELMTGRAEAALAHARIYCTPDHALLEDACGIVGEVLRRQGEIDAALSLLGPLSETSGSKRLRLTHADLLRERGRITEARVVYRSLVDDIAQQRASGKNPRELAIAGRAAHRLGAWQEANDWFDQAEKSGYTELDALIWRAELYLDAHDPSRARAMSDAALQIAKEHPRALLLAARVRLVFAQDIAEAERIAQKLLTMDSHLGDAQAILAGLSLRDLDFERTAFFVNRGLRFEPKHLELLSIRAAAAFLADDAPGFDASVFAALRENATYAKLFRLVAEYAESEHRYGDTVPLLRRALGLDPEDPSIRSALGIQLLRSGNEVEGRHQLDLAFARDPFDLRVRNTLVLYEQKIDKEYVKLHKGPFDLLVPTAYSEVLAAIVPGWLTDARRELQKHYGKLRDSGINVELYGDLDSFGVRTSGVPTTFLQGVCFGSTVVARLPTDEPTNLGMTLWHELSHAYHLRLSNHRVPRWFTEGLAEVETARHRSEWSREQDLAIYSALSENRIPPLKQMNRAFSHATSLEDLGVAYVTSTYLVDYIVTRYGFDRVQRMLVEWGKRKPTEAVISEVLATDIDGLDNEFRMVLHERFKALNSQFIPKSEPGSVDMARARFNAHPKDAAALAAYALSEVLAGRPASARDVLALDRDAAAEPDVLWVESLLECADQNPYAAERPLQQLLAAGKDGYFVRMQLALVARMKGDLTAERAELTRAHAFHPRASEPLYRLAALFRAADDVVGEVEVLTQLARLEEADLAIHSRLVELQLQRGEHRAAEVTAKALSYVNPLDSNGHRLQAQVALIRGDIRTATSELALARRLASDATEQTAIDELAKTSLGRTPGKNFARPLGRP